MGHADDLLPLIDFEPITAEDRAAASASAQIIELAVPAAALHRDPPRRAKGRKRLGDMLIEARLITQQQLEEALAFQRVHGGRIGTVLVNLGHLAEEQLGSTLGRQLGIEAAEVESIDPPPELLELIPEHVVRKYEVVPLARRGSMIEVGMTDPHNLVALDELRFLTGARRIEVRLVTERSFQRFMKTRYASNVLLDRITRDETLDEPFEQEDLGWEVDAPRVHAGNASPEDAEARQPPVVRLANYIIHQAVTNRASDIHIEPYETFFRIRYRIDGRLYTVLTPPQRMQRPLLGRLKAMADLDVVERRRPQDGSIVLRYGSDRIHLRISTLPTVFGEKCVARLVRREAHLADIGRLGFTPEQLAAVRRAVRLPQGLVLVTGPTGSGKTTTLHAIVNFINEPDSNIVAVEEPVESTLPGVNHVPIHDKGGVSYATALRSILRQDPDVVLVGELRDTEVAQLAVRAGLTGHLVLTTLHTNGVLETFARLSDMEVDPWVLGSSVQLVLAQRLLRRVCTKCATTRELPEHIAHEFGLAPDEVRTAIYRVPQGCKHCLGTGYRGRVAVYESLVPNDEIRKILRSGGNEQELHDAAERLGMVTMRRAGIARALSGETTFEEVRRVL